MKEALEKSSFILATAIETFKPDAIVSMVSGGNDSAAAHHVAKEIGVPIDFIMHGNTRTGIGETTDFVREYYGAQGPQFIEDDAGDAYEAYLMRKGFFGRGETAHEYAYHVLKAGPFRKSLSKHIRRGRRNIKILLLNGARGSAESARRGRTKTKIFNRDPGQPGNIWVNHILHFTDDDKAEFLQSRKVEINPVTKKLCRSGECMCGTMQTAAERVEAAVLYPKWGAWIDSLEAQVMKLWPWKWGEEMPKWVQAQKRGQGDMFMPMCQGCNLKGNK